MIYVCTLNVWKFRRLWRRNDCLLVINNISISVCKCIRVYPVYLWFFQLNKAEWGVKRLCTLSTSVKTKVHFRVTFWSVRKKHSTVPCTVWPSTGDSEQLRLARPRTPRWPEQLAGGGGAGSAVRQSGQLSGQCDWCDSTECAGSAQRLQSVVWTVKGWDGVLGAPEMAAPARPRQVSRDTSSWQCVVYPINSLQIIDCLLHLFKWGHYYNFVNIETLVDIELVYI